MESQIDWQSAWALLEWQIELGVTETISDQPIDRYGLQAAPPKTNIAQSIQPSTKHQQGTQQWANAAGAQPSLANNPVNMAAGVAAPDPVAVAEQSAAGADTLIALSQALAHYPHCELKQGARNLVFCDGSPGARVMIIGEAPGREEDRAGRPFVGRAGQLLDKMLAAIDLDRTKTAPLNAVYITNILPWRPPQNRDPGPDEIAMMVPFVARHVQLANPDVIVLMGNVSCQAVLGANGITRLRGIWAEAWGRPVLPMLHPAYLLRKPEAKREAWADLLSLRARLEG